MTQNKTINEQIEEIKKGCGEKFDTFKYEDMRIRVECDRFRLCELCQAKLSTLQEAQKMFLEEIDKFRNKIWDYEVFIKGVRGNFLRFDNVDNMVKELKQKISGVKDDTK